MRMSAAAVVVVVVCCFAAYDYACALVVAAIDPDAFDNTVVLVASAPFLLLVIPLPISALAVANYVSYYRV